MIRRESAGADGRVSLITLDRPERRNAMDLAHWAELTAAVTRAVDDGARAVVITGAGTVFCAGADLGDVATGGEIVDAMEATFLAVREAPIPVLVFLNG